MQSSFPLHCRMSVSICIAAYLAFHIAHKIHTAINVLCLCDRDILSVTHHFLCLFRSLAFPVPPIFTSSLSCKRVNCLECSSNSTHYQYIFEMREYFEHIPIEQIWKMHKCMCEVTVNTMFKQNHQSIEHLNVRQKNTSKNLTNEESWQCFRAARQSTKKAF